MGEIKPGETVAVFGCGPVGLFAQKSAWMLGAGRVIAIDHLPYRLDFARQFADVETLNFKEIKEPVTALKEMTEGRGPDVCIDAVGLEAEGSAIHEFLGRMVMMEAGAATAIEWCINSVRKGGNVSIVGVYGPPWNMIPVGTAMNKNLTIRLGQCNTKRYMPHLLEHVRRGRVSPKAIISHRMTLDQVAEAYAMFAGKQDQCRKIVLTM
jgi:threonine dehydrogenase-like Zn-dependent dehydrogenase